MRSLYSSTVGERDDRRHPLCINNMHGRLVGVFVLTCGRCSRGRPPALSWPSGPCSPPWLNRQRPWLADARTGLGRTGEEELLEKEARGGINKAEINDLEKSIKMNRISTAEGWEGQTIQPKRISHH